MQEDSRRDREEGDGRAASLGAEEDLYRKPLQRRIQIYPAVLPAQ